MWRAAFVAAASLGALVPIPPRAIDRLYSDGVYPGLQRGLTRLSNVVPIALLDVLIVTSIVAVVIAAWRDWRRAGVATMAVRGVVRLLTIAAVVYVVFLVCWGLNYRRTPLMAALQFDAQRVTGDAAEQAAATAVAKLNALHDAAHERELERGLLAHGAGSRLRRLSGRRGRVCVRVRRCRSRVRGGCRSTKSG